MVQVVFIGACVIVLVAVTWYAGRRARLRFAVEDKGAGVPAADEAGIFEPFFRGSGIPDGVRGTGLGLSIARQLAEAQGGRLTYTPRDGGGSRFLLELPAGAAPSEPDGFDGSAS